MKALFAEENMMIIMVILQHLGSFSRGFFSCLPNIEYALLRQRQLYLGSGSHGLVGL